MPACLAELGGRPWSGSTVGGRGGTQAFIRPLEHLKSVENPTAVLLWLSAPELVPCDAARVNIYPAAIPVPLSIVDAERGVYGPARLVGLLQHMKGTHHKGCLQKALQDQNR